MGSSVDGVIAWPTIRGECEGAGAGEGDGERRSLTIRIGTKHVTSDVRATFCTRTARGSPLRTWLTVTVRGRGQGQGQGQRHGYGY